MTIVGQPREGLEYYPCRYGRSRVSFRGPRKDPTGDYVAFLGGTETFGRFIPKPFPALIERRISVPCLNLGCVQAGLDVYLNDPEVMLRLDGARVVVIQAMAAQNMSNRFYSVHPRRNDRFVRASPTLMNLFPELDFTEFHFTRHLLGRLEKTCPDRFITVVEELQQAWVARMKSLCTTLRGRVVLLWFASAPPPDGVVPAAAAVPPYVTHAMLDQVAPLCRDELRLTPSQTARAQGTRGMVFSLVEQSAVDQTLNPAAHEELSDLLAPMLRGLLGRSAK
ncbi:DUF6473 family protein [Pseudoprimorskyibacter insulae]|uniref:DUF6473 domain-containing protein n=1 Tax=Pseudoprimorskyibacter insulae TaxID=1695997 RepID=A0A2R8AP14_9RHOB|nr:DUF6473 family protein [Pseudoprimorskyibacter insulae]SPF77720.1 hypothetical protein PRI8871_00304 [Pseudoprimorskyibacter insulae]